MGITSNCCCAKDNNEQKNTNVFESAAKNENAI